MFRVSSAVAETDRKDRLLARLLANPLPTKRSRGLAILLQEMEGYFYNGVIAPVLQDRFPGGDWFIVNDAVFASSAISEEVQSLLNELCLGHFGVEGLFSL